MPGPGEAGLDRRAGGGSGGPGRPKLYVAQLKFDSLVPSATPRAGIRDSGSFEPRRQLVYATDVSDVVIDLEARARGEALDLDAQVFPRTGEEHDVFGIRLMRDETEHGATVSGELGGFAFEAVPPGVYEMLLTTDRFEVLVSSLDLRMG